MIDGHDLSRIWAQLAGGLVVAAAVLGCTRSPSPDPKGDPTSKATEPSQGDPAAVGQGPEGDRIVSKRRYEKPSDEILEQKLSPMQYRVTQDDATEPPFSNEYWDHHEAGLYVDVATGEPLFSSLDKFESGTGWPSFTRPVEPNRVKEHTDSTLGMKRTEVRSVGGDSHLGHVFDDGPAPRGLRYCINSAALRFIPVGELAAAGYGEYASIFQEKEPARTQSGLETAVLAGGCFWGMEEILREIPGVVETDVGYAGGATKSPAYEDVKTGTTGHAESVRIVFDPSKVSYAELLEKWFFRMHDPTTRDRQGNDVGSQYRSAIFVASPEQRKIAEEVKRRVDESGRWEAPVVTQIVEAGAFTPAEDYHQDYLQKNPGGYTCHFMRD